VSVRALPLREVLAIATALLVTYLLVVLLAPGWLHGPGGRTEPTLPAAAVVVGALTVDALVPVPSSIVMVTAGATFGAATGSVLGFLGLVGASLAGFAIGRLSRRARPPSDAERAAGSKALAAMAITRALPLVAETMALEAGRSDAPWGGAVLSAAVGAIPVAVGFAVVGSIGATGSDLAVVGISVVVGGALVVVDVAVRRRPPRALRTDGGDQRSSGAFERLRRPNGVTRTR
jgi:uncharacterized membrane protein YdjX (TVP38/TMEM64 family)